MNIGGHGLRDHLRLLRPLFALIAVVWILHLVWGNEEPARSVWFFSVTIATAVSVLAAVLLIHVRRFGGYPNVALATFLLVLWEQLLIVAAIAFSLLSGKSNIYSAEEYRHAMSPLHAIAGHLTFIVGVETVLATAMGCLLLWLLQGDRMKIGGHGVRDHVRLLMPLFALIAAVWILRLILYSAGAPPTVVWFFSVSIASAISVLAAVVLIYVRRFGGYPNIAFATFLLALWQQILVVAAIALSILSGKTNVYTAPEYSRAMSPSHHIAGHLTFGLGVGTLLGTAMGCLLLWLLRRLVPFQLSEPKH